MSNVFREDGDYQNVGGYGRGYGYGDGGGFGSGIWAILLVVIVLWLLFKDGHKDGGNYGGGYGMPFAAYPYPPYYGGNCNSPLDCKIPMAPDMSNCEVDRDLWKVDADLLKCCCEEKEVTHCEGEKTRALIEANYVQDLRDKLAEKACEVQNLKTQAYTDAKFDALNAKLCKNDNDIDKQFCKTDMLIEKLMCEIPKRPPIWCEGITPNTHHTDCHHDDFPRRRGFHNDCDFGCGC